MTLGLTTKQLIQKDFLMYKYKPLSKLHTTISAERAFKGTLLGICESTGHLIYSLRDNKDLVLYAVLTLDTSKVKTYTNIALYWQMFEDSTTWDEVQIWDDVGRLAVLTRKAYKLLKNS